MKKKYCNDKNISNMYIRYYYCNDKDIFNVIKLVDSGARNMYIDLITIVATYTKIKLP